METKKLVKKPFKDQEIEQISEKEDLSQYEFVRVYAVRKTFKGVVFKQSNILSCYFRNCRFIDCDFTGVLFKESNFIGSQFENCKFLYSFWDKTIVDEAILNTCLPSEDNLARDLVRSLRVNFAQIGNHEAVNKAAAIEVKLTGKHLYNAAYSKQSYYRNKYKGWDRAWMCLRHASWKALDLLWGNGESLLRVVGWGLTTIAFVALTMFFSYQDIDIWESLGAALSVFWGVRLVHDVPQWIAVFATVVRFLLFGLFMAILVKRLSRR
jgi:hypothetical protein